MYTKRLYVKMHRFDMKPNLYLFQKPSTTIRFFSRNDFYTVHGTDAIFTAKEFFKTTSFVKTYASGIKKK